MATPKKPEVNIPEKTDEITVTAPRIPEPPMPIEPPMPVVSAAEIGNMVREAGGMNPTDSGEIVVTAPIPGLEDNRSPPASMTITPIGQVTKEQLVPDQPEPAGSSVGLGSPGTGTPSGGSRASGSGAATGAYTPLINAMMQGPGPITPLALEGMPAQAPAQQPTTDPRLTQAMLQRSFYRR